ncbi:MAG: hydroxymethylpyrimidine/phosphomethylpyrimidine kinase [Candidatus Diapherotrites archaeon]|nr:hydroxymethylpyrimidine/phosphomethylpyrimidine kinase [Candidatus Diapherotrites archaeon]
MPIPKMLVIAGSSSDAGAGVQMDLKASHALGVYAATVLTCITAQNTQGVSMVESVSDELFEAQLKAVLDDIEFDVVKVGVVTNKNHFGIMERMLKGRRFVVDPVMVAATAHEFATEPGALKSFLKNAEICTPNRFEAEKLSGMKISGLQDAKGTACKILALGPKHVLVKDAAREKGRVCDLLAWKEKGVVRFRVFEKKDAGRKCHGAGCLLAGAIAANLAKGMPVVRAVEVAEKLVDAAIVRAGKIGKGVFVVMP